MVDIDPTPLSEPGNPLPVAFEIKSGAALRVVTDPASGLLIVELAACPSCRMVIAPEVALDLALHLVSRVADLRHAGRVKRP